MIDLFTDNYVSSVVFDGREEFKIESKENVPISLRGKLLSFLNVYYVLGMEQNLLSVSQVMRQNCHLHVIFSNHNCYTVDSKCPRY